MSPAGARRRGGAGERFGRLLAARTDTARLMRGLELVERNRVLDLEITRGRVTGALTGSRSDPYWVEVRLPPTGALPERPTELVFRCTCPDWGDPCKHGVALALALGDALDRDPDAAERLLGRSDIGQRDRPRPAAALVPAPLAVAPEWALSVPARRPPGNVEDLFGTSSPRAIGELEGDPFERLAELGPLVVDKVDLAGPLLDLIRRLVHGDDPELP